jgi:DNA-directed RNA polymerase subunit K/omega
MILADQLTKHGQSVYGIAMAASKRARKINDWRIQRSKILGEETFGPKATTQAIEEIATGTVQVVLAKDEKKPQAMLA